MIISAVVVTRNPPQDLAARLVDPLTAAGIPVLVIDNMSDSPPPIPEHSLVTLLLNDDNLGISARLNQCVPSLADGGADWLWYFDQDSHIECADVESMKLRTKTSEPEDGQFSPSYVDRNTGTSGYSAQRANRRPFTPIGSGSLFSLRACSSVGRFEEKLPLDLWDFEISLRLQRHGYRVTLLDDVNLSHEVGSRATVRRLGLSFADEGHPVWRYANKCFATKLVVRRYWLVYPRWCLRHLVARFIGMSSALVARSDRRALISAIRSGCVSKNAPKLPGSP